MPKTCDATIDTADGRTLRCALKPGHDGPVHQDADGEAWAVEPSEDDALEQHAAVDPTAVGDA